MKLEVLCTGDEILTGKTVNTNFSYISQRLTENGLNVVWGTTVGDDRESLINAFLQASQRADAVIVNGGLGPTVDDLSQEVAAEAAGVELECHEVWLAKLKRYYESRGRKMPENNVKQAMLPTGSEVIDNPIGTACGFAIDINAARFFFTPGVPREMHRMVTEQVLPRLFSMSGIKVITRLKRFHTFGIGESRADQLLADIITPDKETSIKLGFQTHYPQLETKLSVQGTSEAQINLLLEPVAAELRTRLGNAILCEDDETLESRILVNLDNSNSSLSCMEMATGGAITNRLMNPGAQSQTNDQVLRQCTVSPCLTHLCKSVGIMTDAPSASPELAIALAENQNQITGSTHSLVALTYEIHAENSSNLVICIAIASPSGTCHRFAILPGKTGWTRLGATELALDCLRRQLTGLPIDEKIDFEKQQ